MRKSFILILLATLLMTPLAAMARDYKVTFSNAGADKVIAELEQTTGYDFVSLKEVVNSSRRKVNGTYTASSLTDLLNEVVRTGLGLDYEIVDNTVILRVADKLPKVTPYTVKGTVTDEEGEPLVGAIIAISGTDFGAIADTDGRFSLKLDTPHPTLTVSYVGMHTADIAVSSANSHKALKIVLRPAVEMMSEVVVTGYQEIKKEKMTGSVATISSDKLEERYTLNLLDNLEGRVAGLSTYGGTPIIRGVGTLNASTEPLLVVDGLPIEGSIEDLNPYDIQSVNVLKDASASAIYGARAANGIIVITTKNAKKQGKIDIDFSANVTWYEKKNMDYHDNFYLTPDEHIDAECKYMEYKYFENDGLKNDPAMNQMVMEYYLPSGMFNPTPIEYAYYQLAKGDITRTKLNEIVDSYRGNNYAREYADAVYRRQVIQQYNLALRSATDKTRNNVVLNYKHDNSGIINHKSEWLNVSYKGCYDIAKWLTATVSINSIYTTSRRLGYDVYTFAGTPWYQTLYLPFYNENGSRQRYYPTMSGSRFFDAGSSFHDLSEDPVEEMYNNTQTNRRQNMRYHGDLLFKVLPGLTANAQFIYEVENNTSEHLATEQSHASRMLRNAYTVMDRETGGYKYLTPRQGGFLQSTETKGNYWTARGQLNYSRTFGKHDIAAIAGIEFRQTTSKGTRALVLGYDEQLQSSATQTVDFAALSQMYRNPDYMSMMGGFQTSSIFYSYLSSGMGLVREERHRFGSGYANITYTYDEKYNVFGSFRKDYADVFGLNAKYRGKPLWSVGAGWNIHKESFARDFASWLNFLKLRVSYGVTGNIYQGATSVMTASSGSINQYTNLPYGKVYSPANPDLRWEQNRTTNVGIDYSLLNYRLRGSVDFYNKMGKDIFNSLNLDPTTGFSSIVANAASIRNRGVEVVAAYDWFVPRSRRDFSWTTSVTFTYNKNVVTEVENDAAVAYDLVSTPFKVGYPVSAMWSYRFAGISDREGEQGQTLFYVDNGGTGTSVESCSVDVLEYSGQGEPKYIVGMDNTWKWNGISLGVVMAYYGGHKIRAIPYHEGGTFEYPVASYFKDSWTPENPTDMPGIGRYQSTSFNTRQTSMANRSVHDASFLKIRNITLGYTVPESWTRSFGINLLSFCFQINDPKALWTGNKLGFDPETRGIRNPSSYMLGLNLNL